MILYVTSILVGSSGSGCVVYSNLTLGKPRLKYASIIRLVVDHGGIGVGLAFGGGNHPADLAFTAEAELPSMLACPPCLRALGDLERHLDVPSFAPIVVLHLGRHLDLKKTVAAIEVLDRLDVAREDRLAEKAPQAPGRRPAAWPSFPNVFARGNSDCPGSPVPRTCAAPSHQSGRPCSAGRRGSAPPRKVTCHVKMSLGLKIVANIAGPFVQQVLIHRAFFEDGNQFLDQPAAQLCAFYFNLYHRPAIDLKGVVQQIGLRVIDALRHGDLGFQTLLLLVMFAQAPCSARVIRRPRHGRPERSLAMLRTSSAL